MSKVKQLTTTALLLAVCVVFQLLKGFSVYLTGSAVNAVLLMAGLIVGPSAGISIAIIAPIVAYLVGATPIINMIPMMLPVIMLGNIIIVSMACLWKKMNLKLGLLLGSVLKAAFLWVSVWWIILPLFAQNVPEKIVLAAKSSFSLTQLITALIGSAMAFLVVSRLTRGKAGEAK